MVFFKTFLVVGFIAVLVGSVLPLLTPLKFVMVLDSGFAYHGLVTLLSLKRSWLWVESNRSVVVYFEGFLGCSQGTQEKLPTSESITKDMTIPDLVLKRV